MSFCVKCFFANSSFALIPFLQIRLLKSYFLTIKLFPKFGAALHQVSSFIYFVSSSKWSWNYLDTLDIFKQLHMLIYIYLHI